MTSIEVLYTALKTKILTDVPAVKTCLLWNNQLPYNEQNISFEFPCVFIEFGTLGIIDLGSGVQMYDCVTTIHIGRQNYELEDLSFFDLKSQIDLAITTTRPDNAQVALGVAGWIPLNLESEQVDSNDTSVYHYLMTYRNRLIKLDTSRLTYLVEKLPPTDLETIKEFE